MVDNRFTQQIAEELELSPTQVDQVIELLNNGATIPFIARYRKDVTGNLNEAQLEAVADRSLYYKSLSERRAFILRTLEEQSRLTEDMRTALEECMDRASLEDLYLPMKKRQRTKGTVAREKGLEPLADYLWGQTLNHLGVMGYAETFARPERSVSSAEEALDGACHILAERLSADREIRDLVRDRMLKQGRVTACPTKNAEGKKTKYEMYYAFSEPVQTIPSHTFLAVLRGVKEGILRMELKIDDAGVVEDIVKKVVREEASPFEPCLRRAVDDAYHHLLRPVIENEVVELLQARADDEAIKVFRANAENILLSPPAGPIPVIGVDTPESGKYPVAIVDSSGTFMEGATLRVRPSEEDPSTYVEELIGLIRKHDIRAAAISNGPNGREAAVLLRKIFSSDGFAKVFCAFVNETGLSVYATSKLAREELPDLAVPMRRAVSIARRLQDPLTEMVKVEPRFIGVGQYQHDVNQKRLREGLRRTFVYCVNRVGVDLARASEAILAYVSGIPSSVAARIVAKRNELGGFASRQQLLEIEGVTPKMFEQCAGFLRITGGSNPLDATGIHPEAYPVVDRMAASLGISVPDLIGNAAALANLDVSPFASGCIGPYTLEDIRSELSKPNRDPRTEFRVPRFRDDVRAVQDLEVGMVLEGVVTNVTDFGVFVDIGVNQDGLVHLSELSNHFVRDPHTIAKVGDVIRVRVIKVDKETPRVSLSMRNVRSIVAVRNDRPKRVRSRHIKESSGEDEEARAASGKTEGTSPPQTRNAQQRRHAEEHRPAKGGRQKKDEPVQRPGKGRKGERSFGPASSGPLNTQLAEQLAAIRDKFAS